jgi:polyisoprenoid-binding protein YceI
MKKWVVGIVIAAVVLAGAGFAFWYTQIRVESKPKAAITQTTASTATPGASPDGSYTVKSGTDTFLGYRAQEVVFGQSGTPTGRTAKVTGTMTVSGTTITNVEITADLRTLATDQARRDQRAQSALDTSEHPDATFKLTQPITLVSAPVAGKTITIEATGDLTIKGITKQVTIPLQAQWNGSTIQVAGSPDIKFSDYGVSVGDFQPFATVQDAGQLDIQVTFAKA